MWSQEALLTVAGAASALRSDINLQQMLNMREVINRRSNVPPTSSEGGCFVTSFLATTRMGKGLC